MGCVCDANKGTQIADQEAVANQEIDGRMNESRRVEEQMLKLLLLGAGASGKSTLLKQMKYLYVTGRTFSDEERTSYRETVYGNIVDVCTTLCDARTEFDTEEGYQLHPDSEAHVMDILSIDPKTTDVTMSPQLAQAITGLWDDPAIKRTFSRRADYTRHVLMDNAGYFLECLERMLKPEFQPTFADVVHTRQQTTGVIWERFKFPAEKGTAKERMDHIEICDVGGQRTERKKWTPLFSEVLAVIYVVALSGYDQILYEDHKQNRLRESLACFADIVRDKHLQKVHFIVFLNKKDLFRQKIGLVPFSKFFGEEYHGDAHDFDSVVSWVRTQFTDRCPHKPVYFHTTQATDTDNVAQVVAFVHDIVIRNALLQSGFV